MKKTLLVAIMAITLVGSFASAKSKGVEGLVNLNTASVSELMLLPGIGKAKAEAIVAYRQAHPFKSPQELTEIKGIGPKMLQKMERYLTVTGPTTLHLVSAAPQKSTP
ncbi:MAG: helix-hairpin-helix domain-containing protein [Deltaproteobacteria bacterium]|nr:helix-hairpin-helix domain-containing protein [Deltaproteobacteria bacterium]